MVKMTVLKNKNIKFIYKGAFLMKKVIAILMVIFLFTVMFYGCGKGEVKDTTLSSVTTATTGTTENTTTPPVNTTVDHVKEYDEKEYMRQLDNLKYGEVPEYLKQIGVPSEEVLEAVREFYNYNFNNFITDPAQLWTDKSLIKYDVRRYVYLGTYDIENNESVLVFHVMFFGITEADGVKSDIVYYKNSGKVDYCENTRELLGNKIDLLHLREHEYFYFYDAVLEIVSE